MSEKSYQPAATHEIEGYETGKGCFLLLFAFMLMVGFSVLVGVFFSDFGI
ncbi:MAG: hypothetical protein KF866_03735 [Phycisphaeraceae bacterium]|nr:hypothetical protein [Phycisphaeraceae bacterium]MCW5753195.1 hypothetical protein [Phycisphaeraceae bacterium]